MRKLPLLALLVGVVMLATGPLIIAGAHTQQRHEDEALRYGATRVAANFASYFERAQSLDLLLAENPNLRRIPDGDLVDPETNAEANKALEYLERLYPDSIGEACLIDDQGHEIARVTKGVPAPMDELSSKEAENAFFQATLDLAPGEVYQAPPYVSPDTHEWVISNSTPVRLPGGRTLVVHFEVSLASFIDELETADTDRHTAVVDQSTGRSILVGGGELPANSAHFPLFGYAYQLGSSGYGVRTFDAGGERLAVAPVERGTGNANDWAVVQWSSQDATMPSWVGGVAAVAGLVLLFVFLVLLRRHHTALQMAARLDHLTGMGNRKALEEALEEAVSMASRTGERIGVLMLDLDDFKQINDTLGHDTGDDVLREIGRRLHANTFETDTSARLGGDEYAIVLRHLNEQEDVAAVAHRLREALVRPIDIDGLSRFVGVSIGAAVFPDHGTTGPELLRAADAAMYAAKRNREGIRVYELGTDVGATASWRAAELLLAIENEEIFMVYQPERAIGSGRIVSVEALARWVRPDGVDVPPSEFVPLAEETGLIRQLTHLTLGKALDQARSWRDAGTAVRVSVNLSARLVTDRSLPANVGAMLAERDLRGDALILEVTETAVIADTAVACDVLSDLRAMGVRIELDDFGSGYASTRALREIPLDGIKVDRQLVNDLTPGGRSLLAATIDLGKVLSLYVVAEGIEDQAVLDELRSLGADVAQGYHLGRPMSAAAVHALLTGASAVSTAAAPAHGSPV
jgi:diguanylate cyclase (GGDEF)-like protein